MFRLICIELLLGVFINSNWPKHSLQQLWEINQTNSFDFIEKFLSIKQPKFEIFVAKPKPKPATKPKLNPPTKPKPKPAENFIISDPKVWQNDSLWLYEQIFNDNI